MATIVREIETRLAPEAAWDAIKDVGAIHKRLVRGFVAEVALEEGARIVTFANGMTAKELIVSVDEKARRLVWSARTPNLAHHNASTQVFDGKSGGSRIVWTADLLPDALAPTIAGMIDAGCAAMKATLDATHDKRR